MGIVIRQSFWSTFFSSLGVALGYVSTLLLFPTYFSIDQIGLIRLIQSNGMMLMPFAIAGMNGSFLKYYPQFKLHSVLKSQIFTYQVLCILGLGLVITIFSFLFEESLARWFEEKSYQYIEYIYVSLIILIIQSIFEYYAAYSSSLLDIVLPTYLRETHLRLLNILGVLGFGMHLFHFQGFIYFMIFNYVSTALILIFYITIKHKIWFSFTFTALRGKWLKRINSFAIYSMIMGMGGSIASNTGFLLTSLYLGLEVNGIFTTAIFIGIVVELPKRAANQIVVPVINTFFAENNFKKLGDLYLGASINLTAIGCLIGIGIVSNLNDLFRLIPQGQVFQNGHDIVIIVVISKVLTMFFGMGPEILVYSKYRAFMVQTLLITSAMVIVTNMLLIPPLGILGAGIAYLLPNLVAQILRAWWLYKKFRMPLFSLSHLKIVVISLAILIGSYFFQPDINPITNIILRSTLITVVFMTLMIITKISNELTDQLTIIKNRLK